MEFFIGEWETTGEMPQVGTYTGKWSYEWIMDSINTKDGMIIGQHQGYLCWNKDKQRHAIYSFGSDGSIGTSLLSRREQTEEGLLVVYDVSYTCSSLDKARETYLVKDENTFTITLELEQDGKYQQLFTLEYTRKN